MTGARPEGIVELPSRHSVDDTVRRLEDLLGSRSIKVFVVVDHSGEAESAGVAMPPTKLVIFGNPKSGTPLMLAAPSTAIDLPLKILVRQDAAGQVWVAYNSPEYLRARHGFPEQLIANIAAVEALARAAAAE
jgi:uncharacterized protein (DUF302 family)